MENGTFDDDTVHRGEPCLNETVNRCLHECLHYDGLQEIITEEETTRFLPQFTCRAPKELASRYSTCHGSFLYDKHSTANKISIDDKTAHNTEDGWYLLPDKHLK